MESKPNTSSTRGKSAPSIGQAIDQLSNALERQRAGIEGRLASVMNEINARPRVDDGMLRALIGAHNNDVVRYGQKQFIEPATHDGQPLPEGLEFPKSPEEIFHLEDDAVMHLLVAFTGKHVQDAAMARVMLLRAIVNP